MPDLDGLAESPEARIVKSFHRVLRDDPRINTIFDPVRLIELPQPIQMPEFAAYSLVICPTRITGKDWAQERQTTFVDMFVGFFLPWEDSTRDSELRGLDLLNLLRMIAWENVELKDTIPDPDKIITIATMDVRFEPLLPLPSKMTRVVWAHVVMNTDIWPRKGVIV